MTERRTPTQRSWLEVRWRQLRNPPPPVTRAILANIAVATAAGVALLLYSLIDRTAELAPAVLLFVLVVVSAGSFLTYLWVELPTGASGIRRRSAWAAMLGLFAAVPVAYLTLVVVFQVVRPLLD